MMADFWLGVAQSAIGSSLGFVLGICAFHYQQQRQSASKEMNDWRAACGALNRLTTASGANIEALVNAKLQFVNKLRPEVKEMTAAYLHTYDVKIEDRAEPLQKLIAVSETLRFFYLTFPKNSIMPPPETSEYSSLSKDMPALSMFVHRAMGMMQEINERIESRNALIAELARERGAGTGLSGERIVYFSSMLSDEGEAICEHTDFALDFWRLALDQIQAYMKAKGEPGHILEYKLIPKALEAMPDVELFPLMREQLTTFTD